MTDTPNLVGSIQSLPSSRFEKARIDAENRSMKALSYTGFLVLLHMVVWGLAIILPIGDKPAALLIASASTVMGIFSMAWPHFLPWPNPISRPKRGTKWQYFVWWIRNNPFGKFYDMRPVERRTRLPIKWEEHSKSYRPKRRTGRRVFSRKGYLYLVQSSSGHYKIGRTSNIEDRLRTFSVKLPFEIELLHTIACVDMFAAEETLHARYEHRRLNGEWFALTPAEVEEIKTIERL